jgi:hypothetical protein
VLDLHHHPHAQAPEQAPYGSLADGVYFWYGSFPGKGLVPLGFYNEPPPADQEAVRFYEVKAPGGFVVDVTTRRALRELVLATRARDWAYEQWHDLWN